MGLVSQYTQCSNGEYKMDSMGVVGYNLLYNVFSFTFALMMAATLFFWLNLSRVSAQYRLAISITGLVTFIAGYHYLQIFLSFGNAYHVMVDAVVVSGKPFNDAYRYVDWLLTVPLLLIELILVMKLTHQETISRSVKLGLAAAAMVILGYPGEISIDMTTRFVWWILSMIPFLYIIYELFFGLRASISKQPKKTQPLVRNACYLTVVAWCFYPIVYLLPNLGFLGGDGFVALQVGYSIADIVAKAGFGILIFLIARSKSSEEGYAEL